MRKSIGILLLSAFSFVGCVTIGDEFPSEVKWIELLKTSKSEITEKLGAPCRTGYNSGLLTYNYCFYRYSLFRTTRVKDLEVKFNPEGKVASYSFSSSFPEDLSKNK